ncbi:ABC transporter permease [Mycoplasma zalophidermidis]|uniref:ABC transporter permease n=1 Tax=Mycoplasma zalophidermidis TaxID=398174 RepID=UPI001C11FD4B|nr:ABC transporter permease [Mycoplasma zalophidermidis]MBU4689847.1 ABC transporter permease [Mycoplasma zalophidermidis]MCR8966717.1 ABC transporter permease [Mycoplasma zalophidermidis]
MSCSLAVIFYFVFVVVGIPVWYNPQYVIPLAGMLVGNSMNGISLGIKVLVEQMNEKREEIEVKLMLGATPKAAFKAILLKTFWFSNYTNNQLHARNANNLLTWYGDWSNSFGC